MRPYGSQRKTDRSRFDWRNWDHHLKQSSSFLIHPKPHITALMEHCQLKGSLQHLAPSAGEIFVGPPWMLFRTAGTDGWESRLRQFEGGSITDREAARQLARNRVYLEGEVTMNYQSYEPVDPREAFTVAARPDAEGTQSAAASQAAFLLWARAGVLGVGDEAGLWSEESKEAGFELPDLQPLQRSRRLKVEEATYPLGVSAEELAAEERPRLEAEMAKTVRDLYDAPSTEKAAALFEASMRSEHPLVAVAAAAGARETTRLRKTSRRILEDGTESTDQLVAGVAREVLRQIDPQNEHLQPHVGGRTSQELRDVSSHTAVVTHGTWARDGAWYQPGGDFYVGLSQNRPDLHLHNQSFQWSGGYSHGARRLGAIDLEQWLVGQQLATPDFFSHSHGGTVAHLATGRGVTFDRLVLMSWPVHQQWFPDFSKVNRIVDVRVRADLVILADRGGQRFRTNQFNVEEHRHGWFNHFSTHESDYWNDHDLWDAV